MTEAYNEDIGQLEERFERAPESRLFAPLADAYRKEGRVDQAIEIVEQGLERYPEYASAHVILGKCFYDKGATERAKAEFERVVELDRENMVALRFLGNILLAEGNREGAAARFRALLQIDPTNEEAAATLEEMENEFRVREIDLGTGKERAAAERPGELATMTLAGIYASQGYYNKALGIYRDVLKREPDNVEAKSMLEKLGSLVDESEQERDRAFDDEVLTISVEDVGDELAGHTAGPGGAAGAEEPELIDDVVRELDESESPAGDGDAPFDEARPAETAGEDGGEEATEETAPAERTAQPEETAPAESPNGDTDERSPRPDESREEPPHPGIKDFRDWLDRLKGDD